MISELLPLLKDTPQEIKILFEITAYNTNIQLFPNYFKYKESLEFQSLLMIGVTFHVSTHQKQQQEKREQVLRKGIEGREKHDLAFRVLQRKGCEWDRAETYEEKENNHRPKCAKEYRVAFFQRVAFKIIILLKMEDELEMQTFIEVMIMGTYIWK